MEWREIERGFQTAFGERGRYDVGAEECGCCLWWSLNGRKMLGNISAIGVGDEPAIEAAEEFERTGYMPWEKPNRAIEATP